MTTVDNKDQVRQRIQVLTNNIKGDECILKFFDVYITVFIFNNIHTKQKNSYVSKMYFVIHKLFVK